MLLSQNYLHHRDGVFGGSLVHHTWSHTGFDVIISAFDIIRSTITRPREGVLRWEKLLNLARWNQTSIDGLDCVFYFIQHKNLIIVAHVCRIAQGARNYMGWREISRSQLSSITTVSMVYTILLIIPGEGGPGTYHMVCPAATIESMVSTIFPGRV